MNYTENIVIESHRLTIDCTDSKYVLATGADIDSMGYSQAASAAESCFKITEIFPFGF